MRDDERRFFWTSGSATSNTRNTRARAGLPSLLISLALAAVVTLGCTSPSPDGDLDGFSVLLITLDTTRADHLGCYGGPAETPALDRLAREGALFEQASAVAPVTLPTHTSILTGLTPPTHGVRGNGVYALSAEPALLPDRLRREGYQTAAVLAATVLDRKHGLARGFDRYEDDRASMTTVTGVSDPSRDGDAVTEQALEVADDFERDRPYMLWVHYFDPHYPYEPPEDIASRRGPSRHDLYIGEIEAMDRSIDRLLQGLRRKGLLDRTLIVVVGDHGEGITGPHDESTHGLLLYEDTLRIPLIFHAAGRLPAGRRDQALASQVDVLPTVLELLGFAIPDALEGDSLVPRLLDEPVSAETPASSVHYAETFLPWDAYSWSPLFQVRRGNWKLVDGPRRELYRLDTDPEETDNLVDREPDRVRELLAELERIRGANPGSGQFARSIVPDAKEAARLRQLGYVESVGAPADIPELSELRHPADCITLFDRLDRARFLQAGGQLQEAMNLYEEILAADPTNFMAASEMASACLDAGRPEDAERWYREVMELRPNDPSVHSRLATTRLTRAVGLLRQGRRTDAKRLKDQALEGYRRAIELGTVEVVTFVNAGRLYSERKRYDEAISTLAQALAIEPGHPQANFLLGYALAKSNRHEEALDPLQIAHQAGGEPKFLVDVQRLRADCYVNSGRRERAIECLEWIVQTYPNHPEQAAFRAAIQRLRSGS